MSNKRFGSLSDFLKENCYQPITRGALFESVNNRDIDKAMNAVSAFLKKRGIYTLPTIEVANVEGFAVYMVCAFTSDNKGCAFMWRREDVSSLHGVMFSSDFDTCYAAINTNNMVSWDSYVQLKGASIVRAIQLVADVMKGKTGMDTASLNKAIRDAQIWESVESEMDNLITEDNECEGLKDIIVESDDAVIKALEKKKQSLYMKIRNTTKKGGDVTDLQTQYDAIKAELQDARISVKANVKVSPVADPAIQKMEDRFEEEERALPEERFGDMESYILNVILGLDVSALICGAPGVGKTYRIMQAIKKEGKVRGIDYDVIKGKATPLSLYTMMHDYQKPGQLLIIDDADNIIKDEVCINLIKAATDSSDERIVAYASSAAPLVPEEKMDMYDDFEMDANGKWRYPKNFVYEGGIIIITNMNAGAIDTAIRSRALICDLNFTTDEVLQLVEGLSPHIMPEVLKPEAKTRALQYLHDLADSGAPMEISIRSFTLCAKMYMSNAPEKDIERRIKEQMRLKFLRAKSNAKY